MLKFVFILKSWRLSFNIDNQNAKYIAEEK